MSDLQAGSVHRTLERAVTALFDRVLLPRQVRRVMRDYEDHVDLFGSPLDMLAYVKGVIVAWYSLAIVFGLLMVGLAYIGDQAAGTSGRDLALSIGLGCSFFCATGGIDATYRSFFAYAARRRYQRNRVDGRYQRLMRRAYPRNSSLLLQGLVGVVTGIVAIHKL